MPNLHTLNMAGNMFGDEGAKAIAAAVRSGRLPESLKICGLNLNVVGDEGARRLANAILETDSDLRPALMCNCIGIAGHSALVQAFEGSYGVDFMNYFWVIEPFNLPPFLERAVSRGWRRFKEGGIL